MYKNVQGTEEEFKGKPSSNRSFVSSSDESVKPCEIIRDNFGVRKKTLIFPISENVQTLYSRDSLVGSHEGIDFFVFVIFGKYENFQKNMTICKNFHIFISQFEYENYFVFFLI